MRKRRRQPHDQDSNSYSVNVLQNRLVVHLFLADASAYLQREGPFRLSATLWLGCSARQCVLPLSRFRRERLR